nr:WecB/TagA/CpsF family glycosyltransferase [uncultured Roseococcus sp.]
MIAARDPSAPLRYVVSVNVQHMVMAQHPESGLAPAMSGAWLRLNDSRILARLHRMVTGENVPLALGSDLTAMMLDQVIRPDDPITIIGGGPLLVPALRDKYRLKRIAQHEPPMGYMGIPEAREAAISFAEANPARFLFVSTGAPGSEILLAEMAARRSITGTGLAFGSALLFSVGITQRAPWWMQKYGLEWLHRAFTSPRRLGKRYAKDLIPLIRQTWRARSAEVARRRTPSE